MALTAPIAISDQANVFKATLTAWATPLGGTVKVVANMQHLWEEIYPVANGMDGQPRVLIVLTGETARERPEWADRDHRVDRQWTFVILRGHGWENKVNEVGVQNESPFYSVVENLRDTIRTISSVSEEFPINYRGIKTIPNLAPGRAANIFIDGFGLDFTTANDIPDVFTQLK